MVHVVNGGANDALGTRHIQQRIIHCVRWTTYSKWCTCTYWGSRSLEVVEINTKHFTSLSAGWLGVRLTQHFYRQAVQTSIISKSHGTSRQTGCSRIVYLTCYVELCTLSVILLRIWMPSLSTAKIYFVYVTQTLTTVDYTTYAHLYADIQMYI